MYTRVRIPGCSTPSSPAFNAFRVRGVYQCHCLLARISARALAQAPRPTGCRAEHHLHSEVEVFLAQVARPGVPDCVTAKTLYMLDATLARPIVPP